MALSLKGRVLYTGRNQGPWNLESENRGTVDVRAELDEALRTKTRAVRRRIRKEVKAKLRLFSGKMVRIEFTDHKDMEDMNDGEVTVKEEPVPAAA